MMLRRIASTVAPPRSWLIGWSHRPQKPMLLIGTGGMIERVYSLWQIPVLVALVAGAKAKEGFIAKKEDNKTSNHNWLY